MAKKTENRVLVTLTCSECKTPNYRVSKNTKNNRGTRLPYSGGSRLHFKARGQGVYIKAS